METGLVEPVMGFLSSGYSCMAMRWCNLIGQDVLFVGFSWFGTRWGSLASLGFLDHVLDVAVGAPGVGRVGPVSGGQQRRDGCVVYCAFVKEHAGLLWMVPRRTEDSRWVRAVIPSAATSLSTAYDSNEHHIGRGFDVRPVSAHTTDGGAWR